MKFKDRRTQMIRVIKYPKVVSNTLFLRIPKALQDEYLSSRKAQVKSGLEGICILDGKQENTQQQHRTIALSTVLKQSPLIKFLKLFKCFFKINLNMFLYSF